MVGGGILERKIITARNGTEGNHAEDREMECCHQVMIVMIVIIKIMIVMIMITRQSKNRDLRESHEKAET